MSCRFIKSTNSGIFLKLLSSSDLLIRNYIWDAYPYICYSTRPALCTESLSKRLRMVFRRCLPLWNRIRMRSKRLTRQWSPLILQPDRRQAVSLTDLLNFQMPALTASGTTSLGEALSLTASFIAKEVQKTTADTKGDWRPLVFLMTNGSPNDDWRKGLNDLWVQWVDATLSLIKKNVAMKQRARINYTPKQKEIS